MDQSGESRQDGDYGLQGESTYTNGSRRSLRAPAKMAPPILKERKWFQAFQTKVTTYAKYQDFNSVLHSETHLDVGDDTKSRVDFICEGVDSETYERHLRAWFFFSQAFDLPIDLGKIFKKQVSGKFLGRHSKILLSQEHGRPNSHEEDAQRLQSR